MALIDTHVPITQLYHLIIILVANLISSIFSLFFHFALDNFEANPRHYIILPINILV